MIEQPPNPSRLLRCLAGLARWSLGLLIAFWLLVAAAWGVLHGWIVPRIGDFRPQLEAHATRALGVPVRIGSLSARSEGLVPTIELNDVALLDPQGREALKLPRVVGSLSPRSVLRMGFEQLYIERPELDVRRMADGRIFIAGLAFRQSAGGDSAGADWLFSQAEVVLRGGTVRLTDETGQAPALALGQVDLLLRNRGWRHGMRIEATPPPEWGDRFKLTGQFRQPFLTTHGGSWQQWTGQLFADFSRVDVARLRHHVHIDGVQVAEGRGALRAWIDFQRGQFVGGTADLALAGVNARLGEGLEPLALQSVAGRVGGRRLSDGFEFSTEGLQFTTQDALRWPGGNLMVRHTGMQSGREQGELRADRLDLAALAQIASRLPLDAAVHSALADYTPRGLVEEVKATWRGPLRQLQQYQARGKVTGLAVADQPRPEGLPSHSPGLRGASVEFDVSQSGGKATLAMVDGALVLPKVFEEGTVPVDRLSGNVRWQIDGERIAVQASELQFANTDAQGEARLNWHTGDAERAGARPRFPGVLDLSGTLSRADGTRVHRYLPLSIPQETRHYVRDAVTTGTASNVQFRVKGDLHDIPFNTSGQGDFHIAARVKDVTYAYVPPRLQHANEAPWPALTELTGDLIFDRSTMAVKGASGSFAGTPKLRVNKVEARIPDLAHTVVAVNADARGPLADMLSFVTTSPLARITGNALDKTTANGTADLQLALSLPISHIDQSKVQGSVTLAGNDVRIAPDAPAITRARGAVQFTDTGFTLAGMQGRALGGDMRLEGGMRALPAGALPVESAVQVRAQGVATADGLRQASQWPGLAQLAQRASGSTPYTLALGVRRGTPEVQVTTTLQGLALDLPAPLGKTAEALMPVRFETQLTRESLAAAAGNGSANGPGTPPLHEHMALDLGALGSVTYVRDISSATQPRVLRGAIALGLAPGEAAPLPERGVVANVQIADLDADAWHAVLHGSGPVPPSALVAPPASAPASAAPSGSAAGNGAVAAPSAMQDYLPTQLALRARQVDFQGRTLHGVVMGGSRDGNNWRANVDAQELNGYVEFRQGAGSGADAAAGRLFARLSRLAVPQSDPKEVDELLAEEPAAGAGTLPSLDIVVDDFELRGRRLGRIEIEAQNRGGDGAPREWRLSKFNIVTPEATLTANGNWALLGGEAAADARRRTVMNFKLDIRDSGDLLTRFGMADVVRRGKGRMEGQVAWMGPPLTPDYRTMSGQMNVNVESGQFLKADPGLAKLLGVLSLQSLPRRLTLDFRDVFSEGFAFDFVRGDVRMEQGVATTNNLQMKGVNAAVLMEGSADLDRETQDLHVVVVPEINAMTASLVATAINPVVGLGSFLAQVFLRGPLIQAATQEFRIDGTWTDPRIERVPRRKLGSADPAVRPPTAESPTGDKS
ncbi:YhdP family protein [Acidovorax sp. NCPPB 3576]|uniref:YhdP family protein n=1 Tax=Acidovorax sp. NCPPB 3576 TaxID=2940488 RepID=UPI002349F4BA|nr:YhdP family protein [Acidovorax sp. NCPPB 3576]WCM88643.1 TIGR02099 family protein [Acidovorax sp. NCPPB 3576]